MTTGYVTHDSYVEHRLPGYNHPENPRRIQAVWEQMEASGLHLRMTPLVPTPATGDMLLAVHSPRLIAQLARIADEERLTFIDQDTYALPVSWDIARLSAGGVVRAVQAVARGEVSNALAVTRPPGHHATINRSMGFCILSNVAIAARYALDHLGIERLMIVDYDVHHGNGTQDVFYKDDRALFISTHQYPFYPATGALGEVGEGQGRGFTINIPLSSGHGDASYRRIFNEIVWKAAQRYQPQLIIVSAGFDAHWRDPLGQMRLTLAGYDHLTRELIRMAQTYCAGRIVFAMEGGYDLTALGHGVRNIAHALLGESEVSDPLGEAGGKDPDVGPIIEQVRQLHRL